MNHLNRLFLKQIAITKPRLIFRLASGELASAKTEKEKLNADTISIFLENFEANTDTLVKFLKSLNFKQLKAIICKNMSGDSIKKVLENIKLDEKELKVLRLDFCTMTFDTFNEVLQSLPFKALEIASLSFDTRESIPKTIQPQKNVETILLESFAQQAYTLPIWLGQFVAKMFPRLTQIDLRDLSSQKPMTAINFIIEFRKVNKNPALYISDLCKNRMNALPALQNTAGTYSDADVSEAQSEC